MKALRIVDPRELIAVDLDDPRLEIVGTEGAIYSQGIVVALAVSVREGLAAEESAAAGEVVSLSD